MAPATRSPAVQEPPSIPVNHGPPSVKSKELRGVVLLRSRRGFARLDYGPWLVLYAITTLGLVARAVQGEW
jgi:hypothetical protein